MCIWFFIFKWPSWASSHFFCLYLFPAELGRVRNHTFEIVKVQLCRMWACDRMDRSAKGKTEIIPKWYAKEQNVVYTSNISHYWVFKKKNQHKQGICSKLNLSSYYVLRRETQKLAQLSFGGSAQSYITQSAAEVPQTSYFVLSWNNYHRIHLNKYLLQ